MIVKTKKCQCEQKVSYVCKYEYGVSQRVCSSGGTTFLCAENHSQVSGQEDQPRKISHHSKHDVVSFQFTGMAGYYCSGI